MPIHATTISTKIIRLASAEILQARFASGSKRIAINIDPALSMMEDHMRAANELARMEGITGSYVTAMNPDGTYLHINVTSATPWEVK